MEKAALFGLVVLTQLSLALSTGFQSGKAQITSSTPEGYYCESVTFPSTFSGRSKVRVFVSVNHGDVSTKVHDVTFPWVKAVTNSGFSVCMVESGLGSQGNATVDWVAVQGSFPGVTQGTYRFSGVWTTGSQCKRVTLSQAFASKPFVLATAHHSRHSRKQDAMALWLEGIEQDEFSICLREARLFDGKHQDIDVEWMAFTDPPSTWSTQEHNKVQFPNDFLPSEDDNYAFCKVINFKKRFFSPPVITITPSHKYDRRNANSVTPECNAISAWHEDINKNAFKMCVKDLVGLNSKNHPITVSYMVTGALDPCANVSCNYFAVCKAFAPDDAQCVCIDRCPSYEDPVCSTSGETFDNLCLLKQRVCRIMGNFTYYHPGNCMGFPVQKGTRELPKLSSQSENECAIFSLEPYTFYPDKKVHVQLTLNHNNASNSVDIHDAPVYWVENVSDKNFTACVTKAGRNDRRVSGFSSIDWLAYQGAPRGGVSGAEKFSRWWTGTTCKLVTLPSGKFNSLLTVLVTPEHFLTGLKRDAATAWTQDVTRNSFKICLRELQNFDGVHEEIHVSWLTFDVLHRPLFSEHGKIHLANGNLPLKKDNYAFCKNVQFSKNHTKSPVILLTASHDSGRGRLSPDYNTVTTWVEGISRNGFRACAKLLYVRRYDPLTLHYAVLSDVCGKDWKYFNGYCYRTMDTCVSWRSAQGMCLDMSSSLSSVHNQEENVFVQRLHNAGQGWIGLNDISSEGNFSWSDNSGAKFTFWAKNQPNNLKNQDCVHTLGKNLEHDYQWNDVSCSDCHNFTCKRDYNECEETENECDAISKCVNTRGSYTCQCPIGYTLDGFNCQDVDECNDSSTCHVNAQCVNTPGSFTCTCKAGYSGDGRTCVDVDECSNGTHGCHSNAQCINTAGSYTCKCNIGHAGSGYTCTDVNECGGSHGCNSNAQCINTPGSFICRCNSGYSGNGFSCVDVNECGGSHGCHSNAQCINTAGSFICRCNAGYTGNGFSCVAIAGKQWISCWRMSKISGGSWSQSSSNAPDAIDFSVNVDRYLRGYLLWGPPSGWGSYTIRMELYNDRGTLLKTITHSVTTSSTTYQVLFSSPVLVRANRWYSAVAHIAGSNARKGVGGITTQSCHSTTLRFKSSNRDRNYSRQSWGQIPAVLLA